MSEEGAAMPAHIKLAIEALEIMRGNNLERARWAFRHYSPEEMQQAYGESGRTCADILAGYEAREAQIDQAIAMLRRVAG